MKLFMVAVLLVLAGCSAEQGEQKTEAAVVNEKAVEVQTVEVEEAPASVEAAEETESVEKTPMQLALETVARGEELGEEAKAKIANIPEDMVDFVGQMQGLTEDEIHQFRALHAELSQ